MSNEAISTTIRNWLEQLVIAESLCPFARQPLAEGRVRFAVTEVGSEDALLTALAEELKALVAAPEIETTLLIHPAVLSDFHDYNQFLDRADALIRELGFEGTFQVASFHPHYQFAGTEATDPENYSNRTPYPLLHLLRESSIEAAVDAHPDIDAIPGRNVRHLQQIGTATLARRLQACFRDSDESIL